mgnify:CR=1 FL=1
MIREQKEYEIGTLLRCRNRKFDQGVVGARLYENAIIIGKRLNVVDLLEQVYYKIRLDSGEEQVVSAKILKAYLKSGRYEILSEG